MSMTLDNMEHCAWSDDEIILRIRMIEEARRRLMFKSGVSESDEMLVMQCGREIATWEELLRRRQSGVRV